MSNGYTEFNGYVYDTARSLAYRDILDMVRFDRKGVTVDLLGDIMPVTGFFVGGASYSIVFTDNPASSILCPPLGDFFEAHSSPGWRFMGAWRDNGKIWLDMVTWCQTFEEAEMYARARNEVAFYDVANDQDIVVADIVTTEEDHGSPEFTEIYGGAYNAQS